MRLILALVRLPDMVRRGDAVTAGMLDGKVALVTGSARGTGEATARLFAEEGARVVVADLLEERGRAVAKDLGDSALFVPLDVGSESSWESAVSAALERFGRLDVLVNNAAVLHIAALEDTTLESYERVVRVNQTGTFLGMRAVIEAMRQVGRGSIVNISSVDGRRGQNGLIAYASSKWAVRGMTRVAAIELGRFGIRVNAVCPEAGSGEMIAPFVPEGVDIEKVASFGQPRLSTKKGRSLSDLIRDVARMVLFLASDESASCTGADFQVDGGNTAGHHRRGLPGA